MALTTLALFGWSMADQMIPEALGPSLRYAGAGLAVIVAAGLLAGGLARLIGRWVPVPAGYVGALAAAIGFVVTARAGASQLGWYVVAGALLLLATLVGGSAWSVLRSEMGAGARADGGAGGGARAGDGDGAGRGGGARSDPHPRRRRWHVPILTVSSFALVATLLWVFRPWATGPVDTAAADRIDGTDRVGAEAAGATVPGATVPDPTAAGPHDVATLTYGSGTDRLRPEYADDVAFRTQPVDATDVLSGWGPGQAADKTALWGFDASALPVNGRVWYPRGASAGQRHPLVVIVHGNTSAVTFSDAGYGYLGQHLATHGYVVASIDENFLNTSIVDGTGIGGLETARAWLIERHLTQWQTNPDNPLRDRVDLTRVALIGHSRGGAAVALAAANVTAQSATADSAGRPGTRTTPPNGGQRPTIRAVVGLAPADPPAADGSRPHLTGVDYLVIHGSHDADVVSFEGLGQLARVTPRAGGVRASLYVEHANHTQFNTRWGNRDVGFSLPKRFIDTAALLTGDDQRRVATGYITAFVELSLRGRDEYGPLLADPRSGAGWLPNVRYLSRTPRRTRPCWSASRPDVATGREPPPRARPPRARPTRAPPPGSRSRSRCRSRRASAPAATAPCG